MRSLSRIIVLLVPFLLVVGCGDDDDDGGGAPQVNPNTAWFVDVSGAAGTDVTMDIMFHNAEPIIMIQMPFTLDETVCQVTDFTFAGSFAQPLLSDEDEDSEPSRYNTWALVATAVPAGDHLYATITFSIDAGAPNQAITVGDYEYIGNFTLDPGNNLYRHFPNFGTTASKVIGVAVTDGTITVQ